MRFLLILIFLLSVAAPAGAQTNSQLFFGSESTKITVGDSTSVSLKLEIPQQTVTGLDTVLNFDPEFLTIDYLTFHQPTSFPFNFYQISPSTNDTYQIHTTSVFTDPKSSYSGSSTLLSLHLTAKQPGSTQISFDCQDNSTTDTNIIINHTTDMVDCSLLTPLDITIVPVGEEVENQIYPEPDSNQPDCSTPTAPAGLEAMSVDSDTILLRWQKDPNILDYSLHYSTNPDYYQTGVTNLNLTNELIINHLLPNTQYYFALSANNNCSSSNLVFATTSTTDIDQDNTDTNQSTAAITLSDTQLEAIPSLDRLLTVQDTPILLDPGSSQDEPPIVQTQPQYTIILIAFIGLTPLVIYAYFKHKNLV